MKKIINSILSPFKFSLSFKITFLFLLLSLTTFLVIFTSIIFFSREYFIYKIDEEVKREIVIIEEYISLNNEINKEELSLYLGDKSHINIYKNDVIMYNQGQKLNVDTKIDLTVLKYLDYSNILNKTFVINNDYYLIKIETNFSDYKFILVNASIYLLIIGLLLLSTTISLSGSISKKMFKPILEITTSAKNITGKNLNARINPTKSYDDLRELSETFNSMLDRIENSYEKQKQFVNDASHELRTPISVIQGYINMLDRWGKDDKEILEESILAIKNESKNMEKLVDSLLLLARMDRDSQQMDKEGFNISDLIRELVKETTMIDTNHKIINNNKEELFIFADKSLLKQAIRVFIQNSIKYTENNGEITLDGYSEGNNIYITIKDNGIGISKEDISNVFNKFFRVDLSRTKEVKGLGLGLSIAKWIIEAHEGEIDLRSELNLGTKVIIKLPYKGRVKNDKS